MYDLNSRRVSIRFANNLLQITSISRKPDGVHVCKGGSHILLVRTADAVSDPVFLDTVKDVSVTKKGLKVNFQDKTDEYRASLHMHTTQFGILFQIKVIAPIPIWLVEWKITGFDLEEVIVPALGGQSLNRGMPDGTTLSYKYPFWWTAQFVVGIQSNGGVWLHMIEEKPRLKLLRVSREDGHFTFSLGQENDASNPSQILESKWYLDCFQGDWKGPADEYRKWMEPAFGLSPLFKKVGFVKWARNINFILELWGANKNDVVPYHTFDQMASRLYEFRDLHSPEKTLVYLPGFAENGIDSHAPDYKPSQQLGGDAEFKKLIETAHGLDYRIMVHTNVLAMTFCHRLYPEFRKYQVIDPFGRPQGWGLDMDGDWLTEPYFAYINPGAESWGELMEGVLDELIRAFQVDGIFLDQTLLAFNVSSGPNFMTGMREHINRLQRAFPDTLFVGEGMHEHILSVLPMAQIHGLDSITNIHGMEENAQWRNVHPVSTYLFNKYVRFTAHLLTKHPSHPQFKSQESAYKTLGIIPALCLYNHKQAMDTPEVRSMIERTKDLNWRE